MPASYPVAFVGFTAFERSALASTFRLSVHRRPAYVAAQDVAAARFIVADADLPGAVDEVLASGRVGQAIFIGAQAPRGAAAWMMRPIDPPQVLRELDLLVARQGSAEASPIGPYSLPVGTLSRRARTQPDTHTRRASDSSFGPDALPPGVAQRRPRPPSRAPEALLVDDSDIALRLLEYRLERLGLRSRSVTSSQQALRLLAERSPEFVFLDIDLGPGSDLDGLSLCRHIRGLPVPPGLPSPVVVMVSANHGEVDRVRGSLAGCDAYLGKPLDEQALRRVLSQHGVSAAPDKTPTPGTAA